ncbi:MAG: type II toxin-antitoxin system Phd/YefM family antitoxin [Gammaproteobacteria bacterium]|nr:type II toxin-antitoxin system Phd/YefM family antitoxin [Gammaproteobacteria bacterium]
MTTAIWARVTPVSAFKKQLASMDVSEPVMVTQNGEPLYVVQDPEQYRFQREQMAMLRMLAFAEKDTAVGRVMPSSELLNRLKSRSDEYQLNETGEV